MTISDTVISLHPDCDRCATSAVMRHAGLSSAVAIDSLRLREHIADYNAVFGTTKDRFVCPITWRECEVPELINGHILNHSLDEASNETVIQYRDVDAFYGALAERSFSKFANLRNKPEQKRMLAATHFLFCSSDKRSIPAYKVTGPKAGRPRFPMTFEDGGNLWVELRVASDDPLLAHGSDITLGDPIAAIDHSHAFDVASLVKSAFLASFAAFGYRPLTTTCGEFVRSRLNMYFRSGTKSKASVVKAFMPFREAAKVHLMADGKTPATSGGPPRPFYPLQVGFHVTSEQMFAQSYCFRINGVTAQVILPASTDDKEFTGPRALELYDQLMSDHTSIPHTVVPIAVTAPGAWQYDGKPFAYREVPRK